MPRVKLPSDHEKTEELAKEVGGKVGWRVAHVMAKDRGFGLSQPTWVSVLEKLGIEPLPRGNSGKQKSKQFAASMPVLRRKRRKRESTAAADIRAIFDSNHISEFHYVKLSPEKSVISVAVRHQVDFEVTSND